MRTLIAAEIRRNRRRVIAPGLAVAIAVAFVVVSFGATGALRSALFRSVAARATLSDVVLTGDDDRPLARDVAARVAAVPGVRRAEPLYGGVVQVGWPDGADYSALASIPQEPALRWMTASTGRLPTGPDEVAVDADTARDLDLRPGASLRLTLDDAPARTTRVVGIADLGAASGFGGMRTVFATRSDAAAWTGPQPAEVDVLAAAGTDATVLRDRIRGVLATRSPASATDDAHTSTASSTASGASGRAIVVRTGSEQATAKTDDLAQGVDVIGIVGLVFAAIGLVVASIVIANTFTAIFAQRARSLALLRCLGATRRQVFRAVLAETLLVGAGAAATGVLLGVGLTALGLLVAGRLWRSMAGVGLELTPTMIAVPFTLGVVVALFSALLPARRATRVAPLAALRPLDDAAARRVSRLRVVLGCLTITAGGGVMGLAASVLSGPGGVGIGIIGGTVTLLGVLLMGPVIVPLLARAVGIVLRRWVPGRVAVGNAVRNPVRASATSVALLLGVSLVTMMSVGAACLTGAAGHVLDREFPVDVAVTAREGGSLPGSVIDGVTRLPDAQATVTLRGTTTRLATDRELDVVGIDPSALATVWRGGDLGLSDGTIVMSAGWANDLHVKDGGVLRLTPVSTAGPGVTGAPVPLRVKVTKFPMVAVTTARLARLTAAPVARAVMLRARSGADPSAFRTAVREQVKGVDGVRTGGSITQRAELADYVTIMLRVVIGLLGTALLIAVVGIANTLALSVLERSRELAVQRALGMTRRQLRASLTAEALVLAVVGAGLGVALGIFFGWAGSQAVLAQTVSNVPLVVPWARIGLMVLLAGGAGMLASILPGRRASRLAPAAALGSE